MPHASVTHSHRNSATMPTPALAWFQSPQKSERSIKSFERRNEMDSAPSELGSRRFSKQRSMRTAIATKRAGHIKHWTDQQVVFRLVGAQTRDENSVVAQAVERHRASRFALWSGIEVATEREPGRPTFDDGVSEATSDSHPDSPAKQPLPGSTSREQWMTTNEGIAEDDDDLEKSSGGLEAMPMFVVHPNSTNKLYWDIFISLCIIWSTMSVPYFLCFDVEPSLKCMRSVFAVNVVVDVSFLVDIAVSFCTAYQDEAGKMVKQHSQIAVHYLPNFFLDFLSTFPFDLVQSGFDLTRPCSGDSGSSVLRGARLFRIVRLSKLFKLAKVARLKKKKSPSESRFDRVNPVVMAILRMLFQLFVVGHIIACVRHSLTENDYRNTRHWKRVMEEKRCTQNPYQRRHAYVLSLYWAFTTMTTVGYGDAAVTSNRERLLAIFTMIVGGASFGYIIGSITSLLENFNQSASLYREKLDLVKAYVYDRQFPPSLGVKIVRHFKYVYSHQTGFDRDRILGALPTGLAYDLTYVEYRALIKHVPLLASTSRQFTVAVAPHILPCFVDKHDFLFFQDEVCTHLYCLATGTVAHVLSTKECSAVHAGVSTPGSLLGTEALLVTTTHAFTSFAMTTLHVYLLPKPILLQQFQLHPDVQRTIKADAEIALNELAGVAPNIRGCTPAPAPVSPPAASLFARHRRQKIVPLADEPSVEKIPPEGSSINVTDQAQSVRRFATKLRHSTADLQDDVLGSLSKIGSGRAMRNTTPMELWRRTLVFHPEAYQKIAWDCFVCFLILFSWILVTYRIGFDANSDSKTRLIDTLVDVLFGIDILVCFNTAFIRDLVLISDRAEIARHYVVGPWFWIDTLSTMPMERLRRLSSGRSRSHTALGSIKLLKSLRLVRIAKITRVVKLSTVVDALEDLCGVNPALLKPVKPMIITTFVAHLFSCVFFLAGHSFRRDRKPSWLDERCVWQPETFSVGSNNNTQREHTNCPGQICPAPHVPLRRANRYTQYLTTLYWAFATMTTVGYGDVAPSTENVWGMVLVIIGQVLGTMLFAYLIGVVVDLVTNLDPMERRRKQGVDVLREFVREQRLTLRLGAAIAKHHAFYTDFRGVYDEAVIVDRLPPRLRTQCCLYVHCRELARSPLLCDLERQYPGSAAILLSMLQPVAYVRDQVINEPGLNAREVHFVLEGTVAVCRKFEYVGDSDDKPTELPLDKQTTKCYGPLTHFGQETVFLAADEPVQLKVTVRCRSPKTMALVLTKADYDDLAQTYGLVFTHLDSRLRATSACDLWIASATASGRREN